MNTEPFIALYNRSQRGSVVRQMLGPEVHAKKLALWAPRTLRMVEGDTGTGYIFDMVNLWQVVRISFKTSEAPEVIQAMCLTSEEFPLITGGFFEVMDRVGLK